MTEDAFDQLPRPRRTVAPEFPGRARKDGITGEVLLRVLVAATGEVLDAVVERATPPGVFDEAARDAVLRWTFDPGVYQGAAVKGWFRQRLRFDLEAAR